MKKYIKILGVIISIPFLLNLTACSEASLNNKAVEKSSTTASAAIRTISPQITDMNLEISGIATLQAAKTTSVFYKDVSGTLKKVMVRLGDIVDVNQPLIEIDIPDIKKAIHDKEISMQRWTIRNKQMIEAVTSATIQFKQTSLDLETVKKRNSDGLDSAQRQIKIAEMSLEKAEKVNKVESNYVNLQDYEKAKLNYDQAKSTYDNAKFNNDTSLEKAQLAYDQAISTQRSASLAKELADIDYKIDVNSYKELKAKLDAAILKSPIKGMVVSIEEMSDGEIVNAGKVVIKIADQKALVLQVTSADAGIVQNQKSAQLVLNNQNYEVEVYTPQPGDQIEQLNLDSKNINKFYLAFKNGKTPDLNLSDSLAIKLQMNRTKTLTIPRSIYSEQNGKFTVQVLKGDKVETVEITKGLENDEQTEILSGLTSDDKIFAK